jgi:hypothetical protein
LRSRIVKAVADENEPPYFELTRSALDFEIAAETDAVQKSSSSESLMSSVVDGSDSDASIISAYSAKLLKFAVRKK